jgi:hypothetical protein
MNADKLKVRGKISNYIGVNLRLSAVACRCSVFEMGSNRAAGENRQFKLFLFYETTISPCRTAVNRPVYAERG